MNSPERVSPEARKPVAGYLWGLLAALTCPCHLPVLAIVLGVEQAVVSPAAISITAMAAGRSRSNCSGLDEAD